MSHEREVHLLSQHLALFKVWSQVQRQPITVLQSAHDRQLLRVAVVIRIVVRRADHARALGQSGMLASLTATRCVARWWATRRIIRRGSGESSILILVSIQLNDHSLLRGDSEGLIEDLCRLLLQERIALAHSERAHQRGLAEPKDFD